MSTPLRACFPILNITVSMKLIKVHAKRVIVH